MTNSAIQIAPDGVLLEGVVSTDFPGAQPPVYNLVSAAGGGSATSANQTAVIGSASGGTAAASSELVGGVYNPAAPSLTSAQQASLQLDQAGRLIVTPTAALGSFQIATGQVSVGTSATLIVAARTGPVGSGRQTVLVSNIGSTDVYVGNAGVTTTTGKKLSGTANGSIALATEAAVYGIVATGTTTVDFVETY